ncbi:universal stress protein [Streptomyces sp. SKN60]|uniref:universal stress protein n=1 Tax=Streptomyces sp. SKN60 TaxID=2855506 RepID=UPI0022458F05|nr:universal stress protein [Streptomyces sp. SKN60]MCX2180076.1 universal stress protein [Streptomyces sp. SKN60]
MDGTTARPGLGRVVVGIDGSPSASTAAMWAAEAARRGSTLCLVHAADTDGSAPFLPQTEIVRSRQAGRELLDQTAEAVTARHPELTVVTELTDGAAPGSLRRAVATTPVVVVRGAEPAEPTEPAEVGVVLAAVRDEADVGCARAAACEAPLRKAPVRLLHIWGMGLSSGPRALLHNGGEEVARDHVRALSSVSDTVREEFPELTVYADGQKTHSVPGALVEASRHADLLVVGGRRSPGYLGPTIGRTTLSLLQHAHCPVELIPRQGPGHGSTS